MIKRGFFYGTIGLMFEVCWTGLCSLLNGDFTMTAHTSLVMLPVYGMVVFLEPMFRYLVEWRVNIFIRGMCYALMIFACEYFSGKVLNLLGICPWLYTSSLNIEGVIRLDYAPLWVIAGIVYEQIFMRNFCLPKSGEVQTNLKEKVEKSVPKTA